MQSQNTEEKNKMTKAIQNEISGNYEITVPKEVEIHIIVTDINSKIPAKKAYGKKLKK